MMAVYFAGKGLLGVVGREEIGGGVGGVARMLLKERKSSVERLEVLLMEEEKY